MTSEEAEKLLQNVDIKLSERADKTSDQSNLRMAYMYGALREACWMHMTGEESLEDILRRA